jgi:hypothetical protein
VLLVESVFAKDESQILSRIPSDAKASDAILLSDVFSLLTCLWLRRTGRYEDSQLPLLITSEDTAWHESNLIP